MYSTPLAGSESISASTPVVPIRFLFRNTVFKLGVLTNALASATAPSAGVYLTWDDVKEASFHVIGYLDDRMFNLVTLILLKNEY